MPAQLSVEGTDYCGATVVLDAPHLPLLEINDPFVLTITAPSASVAPNGLVGVGFMVPITPAWPTYIGNLTPGQSISVWGTVTVAGNLANGIGVAVGVLPPGGPFPVEQMDYHNTLFVPASAPPPAPVPSPANLAQVVLTAIQTGVPFVNANDPSQQTIVQYVQQVLSWIATVTVWGPECLNLAAATKIATAIGGTVVQVVPPSPFSNNAFGAEPLVYGVELNGKMAVAGEIAQQFALFGPGSTVVQIEAGIMSTFH